MPNQSQPFHWRQDVRAWLTEVVTYQQRTYLDFHTAAVHCKASFPASGLVTVAGQVIYKGLAEWAVKTALREADSSLRLGLDDATVEFLTTLAMDVVLPTAA